MALRRSRVRLIVALAIVALGSVVFGWSGTPASGIASTVTIRYADKAFSGEVQAASPCQAGRQVTVVKVKNGKTIGTATTDSAGRWTVPKQRARGKFRATVAASTVSSGGTGYGYSGSVTCDAGTSETIKVEGKRRGGGGGGGGGGGRFNPEGFFDRLERFFDQLRDRLSR